jgi:hypothetical protein
MPCRCMGKWRTSFTTLNLRARGRRVVSFTTRLLHRRGKSLDTHWMVSWEGPRVGLDDVKKRKMSCPCREFNPDSSAVRPVVIPIKLSRLQYTPIPRVVSFHISVYTTIIYNISVESLYRSKHSFYIFLHKFCEDV